MAIYNPSTIFNDPELIEISGLTPTDSGFIVGNGSDFVLETGATLRTSIGVGTGDTPNFAGLTLSGDQTIYDAANDANPQIKLGSSDAEEIHIQSVYDSGAQTLDYVNFWTETASATANKGLFRFSVDAADILDIDDGGINLFSGMAISVAGTDILDATTIGSSVVASSLTSVGTLTSLSVSGDLTVDTSVFHVDSGNNRVGIGTASPDYLLHAFIASNGISPLVAADDFVIEGTGNQGMTILSGNTSTGNIYFGDSNYSSAGRIIYDHNTDTFTFTAGAVSTFTINASDVAIVGDKDFTINTDALFVDAGASEVGIGTVSPTGTLHVKTSDAAAPTPGISGDDFVIENSSHCGMSILSGGTTNSGYLMFGDAGDSDIGRIRYYHSDDTMRFAASNTEIMYLSTAAGVEIQAYDLTVDIDTLFVGAATNTVGIGTSSPDGTLHIRTSEASAVAPSTDADDFIIENSAACGMTILSGGTTNSGNIRFADASSNNRGLIRYLHTDNTMRLLANNTEILKLSSTVGATINAYDLTVDTDTFFVDASADRVGINTIASLQGALHVKQISGGPPVIYLEQVDADSPFFDFDGVSGANATKSISTWTTGNSIQGFVRIEINGATQWMPFYDAPTS